MTDWESAVEETSQDKLAYLVVELLEALEFYAFPLQTAWHDIKEIEAARRENNKMPIWGPARQALEKAKHTLEVE